MFEQFVQRLKSLFGRPSNPLDNLDTDRLKAKNVVLDKDQARALAQADAIGERKRRLEAEARSETSDLRKREKARQIVALSDELEAQEEILNEIYRQKKLLRRLIRFSEQAERLREYGIDKILGQKLDAEKLRTIIDEATTGASMDIDRVNEVTKMLDEALAYSRSEVQDEDVRRVLDDLARDEDRERGPASTTEDERPAARPVTDSEVDKVLRNLDRREVE